MDSLQEYQRKRFVGQFPIGNYAYLHFYTAILRQSFQIVDISLWSLIFSQQKILIEYIMLDGVNDEEQHAHQLGKLLEILQVVSSYLRTESV